MSRDRSTKAIDYIRNLFVKESSLHEEIRQSLDADGKLGINVDSYEGGLLKFLVQLTKAQTVLEIGTLYGYSTLWFAEALPANGRVISLEKSEEHYEKAKALLQKSELNSKIDLQCGDALELLKEVKFQPDFIFIDADKGGYGAYLDWAMEHVAPGGLIVGDNTFLFGHVYGEPWMEKTTKKAKDSMNYFNETLASNSNFRSIMLPTVEGMTIAQKL